MLKEIKNNYTTHAEKFQNDTIESKTNRSFAHFLCKWGHFERAKSTFKMLPASWFFVYLFKKFRSFIAENLESVGQRASKLLAVKVGGLKKKSAMWPRPLSNYLARVRVVPGSNHSQSLMARHFAALWLTDPKFSAIKDLNPFKKLWKVQDARSSLRVEFALSKWPHFHRVYLVTVCKRSLIAVDKRK